MPDLRERLQAAGDFFAKQRHFIAIRDGVVGALPLVLVGSLFLLLAQPPSLALSHLLEPWRPLLLLPYRMLGGLVALYVTFSTAHSLARSYSLDPLTNALTAAAAYFIAAAPAPAQLAAGAGLTPARFGAGGLLAGVVLALLSVELTRIFVRQKWTLRLPPEVPEAVSRSFLQLIPALMVLSAVTGVVHGLGFDIIRAVELLAAPLLHAVGSLPAALAVVSVDSVLWLLGVHASAALATLKPFWESMLVQNMDAWIAGVTPVPHIATQPFYLWFVWQGGSGGALALGLLLVFARSRRLKAVGRVGIVPVLCNISEPIVYGVPVVLNPILAIPFVVAPLLSTTVAYTAMSLGWVPRPHLELPWTLPAPIGAFLSTGGDVRALLLELVTLGLSVLVYWPFVRRLDRQLLREETDVGGSLTGTA